MSTYLDRRGATEVLRAEGVRLGDTALANLASDAKGPKYCVINGRALYQRDDLVAWITQQASVPPRRRLDEHPPVIRTKATPKSTKRRPTSRR